MSVRRSLAFALADRTAGTVMSLVTMAVVSRVLGPAEVGLFVVAITVVLLVETVRDFGVAACIIQAPAPSPALVRTTFTVMLLLSALLGGGIWALAPAIAGFYGDARLAGMIRIATTAFAFAPFGTPLLALLRRELRFGAVARISVTVAFAGALASVGLVLAGFGAQSLVWASVLASFATALGAVVTRPEPWVFRPCLAEWRRVLAFGAWSSVVTLLGLACELFPRLILGRLLGFAAVGLFTRAVSLSQMPEKLVLSAVQPVVLPALAREAGDRERLADAYLLGLSLTCALHWPALLCLAVLAGPVVELLLGPQWAGVVPLVRVVALASLTLFPGYMAFPVLVALGRVRDMARASLLTLPLSMALMALAARWGLMAVAASLFLTGPLQVGVTLLLIRRQLPFAWAALGGLLLRGGVVAACAAALPLAVMLLAPAGAAAGPVALGLALIGAALGWLAGLRLTDHPLGAEIGTAMARLRAVVRAPGRAR
ncbi:oligosaccharide flippase family protein [Oceanicella sp. SM1341]|uniref:oligosaccharide flippase family protein n=1 Tax=Oceanicella sp. SM1341 TaxID=1548889 RepID=UPI001E573E4B|nr:oligosaccharide flippase family protein [Oceanicella sp. SM1341]